MINEKVYNYKPLHEPIEITKQLWPAGTIPLVYVRTMTFNHEDYIRDCIESILMQKTTFPISFLIHDDASADKTPDIVREYEYRFPHIIKAYYQTENSYSQPDKVERRAVFRSWQVGKYEAICEGDDYWTDQYKLQKQVELMEQNPDCSMCVAQTVWMKDNQVINCSGEGDKLKYDFNDLINGKYFHTSTYLIRKEFLDIYGSANPKLRDGDTSMRLFLSDLGPLILLNEKVSVYRLTGKGIWTGISSKNKTLWHIRIYKSFYYHFKSQYRPFFVKKLIESYLTLILKNITHINIKELLPAFGQFTLWSVKNPVYCIKSVYKIMKSYVMKLARFIKQF